LCGGNIDTTVLGRCLERGLAADGRLCRFVVTVSDRAGGIAELTRRIADIGVRSIRTCRVLFYRTTHSHIARRPMQCLPVCPSPLNDRAGFRLILHHIYTRQFGIAKNKDAFPWHIVPNSELSPVFFATARQLSSTLASLLITSSGHLCLQQVSVDA